ncbi:ribonuclease H-like domain-containing protein [Mycena crocata]|nr:ribonuclease H-like domain-containing protein [Mycena crocata]
MASTAVSVVTNSFVISRLPTKEYYQYDLIFQPDEPIANKRQRVIHLLQTSIAPELFHPRGVYDGKRLLYVSHRLNLSGGAGKFRVHLGNNPNAPVGSPGDVQVLISPTASDIIRPTDLNKLIQNGQSINGKTATATNLLQLLIRQSSNQNNPTNNGRAYFSSAGKKDLPGTGIELWRGFFQSVRPTVGRMLITIDTSIAAVYESGPLMDVALHVLRCNNTRDLYLNDNRDPNFRKLQAHFKNRLIKTKTTGDRTKTIHALVEGPIGSYPFQKDGAPTTIAEHYHRVYNINLQHPRTFGVRLSGRNAPFPVIVPAEFCAVLPGQLYKKRIPVSSTTAAVDFATMAPQTRMQVITGGHQHGVQSPIQGYNNSEFVVDAGMRVDPQPLTLHAKLLAHPHMRFGNSDVKPQNGAWNVMNVQFKVPKQMRSWAVVNFDAFGKISENLVNRTIFELTKCCRILGMTLADPVAIHQGEAHSTEKTLDDVLRQHGRVDLILVLLPSKAEEIRNRVKFWGDAKHGIRTSCLREDKLQRATNQYFNNVAIKINARLGGHYALPRYPMNQRPTVIQELQKTPFMIMGADVSHPGPGVSRPSISSLVWSYDLEAASYVAYSDVQAPREEMIAGLQGMVKRAIRQYGKKNPPPQRIIFYRDGVSEGELETVKTAELAAIQNACAELWKETGLKVPLPKLTLIIVVKRHHTVFFPNDNNVNDGRTGNCRAGLVVDALRSPFASDFYLLSHGAIKGTSRSGHYSVLLDQNFNNDISIIQQLSFELCHVYAKATRSISIPAPVYYADIVCARAKFHVDPTRVDFDASTTVSGAEEFDLDYWKQAYRPVSGASDYDKLMYFL